MSQSVGQTNFAWLLLIVQITFVALFCILVRYHESADAKHVANQLGTDQHLKENILKYPGKTVPKIFFGFFFFLFF